MTKMTSGKIFTQNSEKDNCTNQKVTKIQNVSGILNSYKNVTSMNFVECSRVQPIKVFNAEYDLIGIDLIEVDDKYSSVFVDSEKRTVRVAIIFDENIFIGLSKCSNEDEFDPSIGFQIASARAKIKIEQYKISKMIDMVEELDDEK